MNRKMSELEAIIGTDVLLLEKGQGKKKWRNRGRFQVEFVGARDVFLRKEGAGYLESISLFDLRQLNCCLVTHGVRVHFPANVDYRALIRSLAIHQ